MLVTVTWGEFAAGDRSVGLGPYTTKEVTWRHTVGLGTARRRRDRGPRRDPSPDFLAFMKQGDDCTGPSVQNNMVVGHLHFQCVTFWPSGHRRKRRFRRHGKLLAPGFQVEGHGTRACVTDPYGCMVFLGFWLTAHSSHLRGRSSTARCINSARPAALGLLGFRSNSWR